MENVKLLVKSSDSRLFLDQHVFPELFITNINNKWVIYGDYENNEFKNVEDCWKFICKKRNEDQEKYQIINISVTNDIKKINDYFSQKKKTQVFGVDYDFQSDKLELYANELYKMWIDFDQLLLYFDFICDYEQLDMTDRTLVTKYMKSIGNDGLTSCTSVFFLKRFIDEYVC